MDRLIAAVARLIEFFEQTNLPPERSWASHLREIHEGLQDPSSRGAAVKKLEACFGGMGSLQDYMFHPQNENVPPGQDAERLNRQLDCLLDRCYMEYRLMNKPLAARLYWRWLALRHRGVPPRVLNTFRRRTER